MALSPGTESTSTEALLLSANLGFDAIFSNKLGDARAAFTSGPADSPFHLLGLGVCAFLEAALGMEAGLMAEAGKLLAQAEAGAKAASAKAAKEKKAKAGKGQPGDGGGRFVAGVEYEILAADAVVLLGLTHALSESYMGYLQCMYSLNAAHSKFTKLYKSVFPTGLDAYHTPVPSRSPSSLSLSAASISTASASASPSESGASTPSSAAPSTSSLFGRWGASVTSLASSTSANKAELEEQQRIEKYERERPPNGPVEEMVVAGTAFGFGLFNLVFSLLPKRIQSVVGLLGFKHDRPLALRALAVSAGVSTLDGNATVTFTGGGKDVHGVFAGLVLMTFHGVVLLMSGWQADEANTLRTYKAIVDKIEGRYPDGALWILNRAKILRMSNDAPGAIAVLEAGLAPSPTSSPSQRFQQADTLLVFELAWTLLAQRRHKDAADAFLRLTELNSWSHATYVFIAAGCYVSLARAATAGAGATQEEEESKTGTALAKEHFDTAQMLLLRVQGLLDGTYTPPEGSAAAKAGGRARKVGGKDLPTEVLIRKKLEFYKEKQKRRGGDLAQYVEAVGVSGADELAIFWNTHQRISDAVAEAHIAELASLSPPVVLAGAESPYLGGGVGSNPASPQPNATSLSTLDTPDELALRCLLLGILHRTLKHHIASRVLLEVARTTPVGTKAGGGSNDKTASTWISGVAAFELAVLDLREGQAAAEADSDSEAEANTPGSINSAAVWTPWLAAADGHLDAAQAYAGKGEIDLSSRLDSRVALLRDEIGRKRAVLV
ncbi:hypothetical protein HMN09_00749900 [Mycena chlorophos]|uniref:Mitochondrial outer membrane protein IML2 n=1 Tax=Mycena chlorophos TaxID=658473 RepID=A0A8H6SVN1_MYCCL|nr:hypothetical protein HMN09_00749900 [Mycena chlorophos]